MKKKYLLFLIPIAFGVFMYHVNSSDKNERETYKIANPSVGDLYVINNVPIEKREGSKQTVLPGEYVFKVSAVSEEYLSFFVPLKTVVFGDFDNKTMGKVIALDKKNEMFSTQEIIILRSDIIKFKSNSTLTYKLKNFAGTTIEAIY